PHRRHGGVRPLLQKADRARAAQERHVAFRHGKGEIDNRLSIARVESLTTMEDLADFAKFAHRLADAARAETVPRWRAAGEARNKADDGSFNPVTEADVASEPAMRALIEAHFPNHGIVGEELGERPWSGSLSWSLDP